jgi:peroxiredoxin
MRCESDTLRPGDPAPAFTLEDADGVRHRLPELPRPDAAGPEGPASVVLVFDRGTW